ncbi:MAG TPA: DUF6272 family protein [Spirochaetota bacterium]|jgi:hypothetical protein|nr:MAG: hypothetical protein BWX91_02405 [Spirochaetes bacterium ADurb.Bin133]HNZ27015.1 DUF6272 family protein [Spirochaetota bacterium]HPY88453.1 DUF6272 family protein [Spirochaetota bacterium]HQB62382.1 DUF6272 family protein [Spirochaetota bacterium]
MKLNKAGDSGYLELVFGPRWVYIATVRKFLQNFLSVTIGDSRKADIISMAASELLENAIKYASEEGTKISAHFKEKQKLLLLSVENFTSSENIEALQKQIEIVNSGTPEEMYLAKMLEAAERSDGGSQLGFARIRYESNAKIDLHVKGDLVVVSITFDLDAFGDK